MIYASDLDQTLIYSTRSMGVPADSSGLVAARAGGRQKLIVYLERSAVSLKGTSGRYDIRAGHDENDQAIRTDSFVSGCYSPCLCDNEQWRQYNG